MLLSMVIAALLWAWQEGQNRRIADPSPPGTSEKKIEEGGQKMTEEGELKFSSAPGYFVEPLALELSSEDGEIRYTEDGSEPDESSLLYEGPIKIEDTVVIRARVIHRDGAMGPVHTSAYWAGEKHQLPIVSVTAEPEELWSPQTGILRLSNGAKGGDRDDKRIAGYFQWYEPDGTLRYEAGAGIRVVGGESREMPQKSIALYAKKKYGPKRFEYPFFPDAADDRYDKLVLRNGGQDFARTHMLDGLVGLLLKETEIDVQYYRPVVVYVNGEYYGMANLRDKISDKFLERRHNVKADKLDLLESSGTVKEGSREAFDTLMEQVEQLRLGQSRDYSSLERKIDVDNLFDYMIAELFIANEDWPDHNIRYWRPQGQEGKWRWIFYDADLSFLQADYPAAERIMSNKMSKYPSIRLFQVLMQEPSLRERFLRRFAFRLEDTFSVERVQSVIREAGKELAPEMPRHAERWTDSVDRWEAAVTELELFAEQRTGYILEELRRVFDMTSAEWETFGFADVEKKLQ